MGLVKAWIDACLCFWEKRFTLFCRKCRTDSLLEDCLIEDIEPMMDGRDLYTFVCPICNTEQKEYPRG